jgi:hypothetical protein
MRPKKYSLDTPLDRVIDKSMLVLEKSIQSAEPVVNDWLAKLEAWLDTKLEDPKSPKSGRR